MSKEEITELTAIAVELELASYDNEIDESFSDQLWNLSDRINILIQNSAI